MPEGEFDIYQTRTGVTAVTNPVQRRILAALAEGEQQLPDLVELTGKAKPTLSGIHMKELLNRELVTEHPHPDDSRRKVFRLNARPLGSSGVPVDQLRSAVQEYARTTFTGAGLPLDAAFRVLAAAPDDLPEQALRDQARALGRACAGLVKAETARDFAVAFSQFAEKQGLARHLQIDFEAFSFRCRPGDRVERIPARRMGVLLAGFAEGAAAGNNLDGIAFQVEGDDGAFRLQAA